MSLYENVFRVLEAKIASGELSPGAKLPDEHSLAKQFKVHRLTVRKALAKLQKNGRLVRYRRRGTFVAKAHPASLSIVYIGDMESHLHKDIFIALANETNEAGSRLTGISPHAEKAADYLQPRISAEIAAGSWLIVSTDAFATVRPFLPSSFRRLLLLGRWPQKHETPCYAVILDVERAVTSAIDYLFALGHRRIALLTTGSEGVADENKPYAAAYRYALARRGLAKEEHFILIAGGDGNAEDLKRVEDFLRNRCGVTAVVCDGDFRARLCYDVCRQQNSSIPGDISLIGIGDTPWCDLFTPPLASVNFGVSEAARLAVALCARGEPRESLQCYVAPRVVARNSVAQPHAGE